MDSGKDLCDSPIGPWLRSAESQFHSYFRPVLLHQENIVSRDFQLLPGTHLPIASAENAKSSLQSIRLLQDAYGSSMDPSIASQDPFYALSEVFLFAAASHIEFLSAIASIVDSSITEVPDPEDDRTASFQETLIHCQRVLEWHAHNLSEVSTFIKNRDLLDWPRSNTTTALRSAQVIEREFNYLLQKSQALWDKCQRELNTITNQANFAEARRGIDQGKRVYRITVLASIYVPLSFSCAIFGMNFVQFSTAWLGCVLWAAVTGPIFLITLLIMTWDKKTAQKVKSFLSQMTRKIPWDM